jgi:hypothetical protein
VEDSCVDGTAPYELETDPRFPSGPWTGFFVQPVLPGRHMMELQLTFRGGAISGEGRDWVGRFAFRGHYDLADGRCYWTKRYLGKHDVFYRGYNEGKGIWGTWEMTGILWGTFRGGFHIWPEGMPDPTRPVLTEEADLPAPDEEVEAGEPAVLVPS